MTLMGNWTMDQVILLRHANHATPASPPLLALSAEAPRAISELLVADVGTNCPVTFFGDQLILLVRHLEWTGCNMRITARKICSHRGSNNLSHCPVGYFEAIPWATLYNF